MHNELYAAACGTSPEAEKHAAAMAPWIAANPDLMAEIEAFTAKIGPMLAVPPTKMCDPDGDWYKVATIVANRLKPKGWWVVEYLAPFKRMGLCGKVFFANWQTGRVLFGKRSTTMRDQPGLWDLPAGNWEYGESASGTATREGGDETSHAIPFNLDGKSPFVAEVRYLDYGGEKGRAHIDVCYIVFVDEETLPPVHAEVDEWRWLSAEEILGTGLLAFEDTVNGDACTAAFEIVSRKAALLSLAEAAKTRKLYGAEVAQLLRVAHAA